MRRGWEWVGRGQQQWREQKIMGGMWYQYSVCTKILKTYQCKHFILLPNVDTNLWGYLVTRVQTQEITSKDKRQLENSGHTESRIRLLWKIFPRFPVPMAEQPPEMTFLYLNYIIRTPTPLTLRDQWWSACMEKKIHLSFFLTQAPQLREINLRVENV